MSLEIAIQENTAAIKELIATLAGASVETKVAPKTDAKPAAAEKAAPAKKAPAKKAEPKVSKEEATTAIIKLKDEFGTSEAKAILDQFGIKLAGVTDDNAAKVLEAAAARYEELANPSDDDAAESDDGL